MLPANRLPYPVVCECGFATLNAKKAREHAREHVRAELYAQWRDYIAKWSRGKRAFICIEADSDSIVPYGEHGTVFFVSDAELNDAGGWIACEFCEAECLELKGVTEP